MSREKTLDELREIVKDLQVSAKKTKRNISDGKRDIE